jgi:thiol:disulfide interchange protein DsbC
MPKLIASLLMALAVSPVVAAEDPEATVRAALKSLVPNAEVESIAEAAVPNFYEVVVSGHVFYVSRDGKYLMSGSLWDVPNKRDLTDARRTVLRKAALDTVGADKRIVFKAEKPKHKVTVFTDIDCGYCRRLHQQMADYNKLGITVEYLFFPRAGEGSESFEKAIAVWCAADRNAAMTQAKAGEPLEPKQCDNPISEEYQLGQKIGVAGTPAVITEDGTQIGGYLAPDQMLARLESLKGGGDAAAKAKGN